MSSVESAPLASSDVNEKGPIDFGVKAVALKTQDSSRLHQTVGGPLRSLSTPAISRQSSYPPQHPPVVVVANASQKQPVLVGRFATSPSGMSSGPAITAKPPHTTSSVTPTTASLHVSTTYLLPRGSAQVAPRAVSAITRTNMNVQPVSSVQTMVRAQSPMGAQSATANHVRAPSPVSGQPRTVVTARSTMPVGKPGVQARSDPVRPMMLTGSPARPLTITSATQFHITTDKTMKVPAGAQTVPIRPSFCSVPAFVSQSPATTILQRTDGLQAGAPSAMLTTPLRLAPPLTPLLATQRVAVSVAARLNLPQHVTVCNVPTQPRMPALANRAPTPPTGLPTPAKVTTLAGGTIVATAGRLAYATGQVVTAAPTVPQRMPTPGVIAPLSGKPGGAAPTVVTTGSRVPVANHQVTQTGPGKPRIGAARAPPNAATPLLVVGTGNHVAVRSTLVTTAGSKVIQQTVPGSIQLAPTYVASKPIPSPAPPPTAPTLAPSTTPVISKNDAYKPPTASRISSQPKMYPTVNTTLSAISNAESDHHHPQQLQQTQATTVYIPTTHKPNNPPGLITSQATMVDRSANTPTISTYTLPSGASYIYEAPSGYQLATDAPLVARPLSPDAQLVTRQLSTEGPLIARPFTPGLIATTQTVRYNPMMIVDPTVTSSSISTSSSTSSSGVFSVATSASTDQVPATNNDPSTPGKITSSPRPSILRKRDNEGNVNVKVVKNLSAALSGTGSRSRTPSPPTSLHCETNQAAADVGPSSNGSTTISATSSPCPEDAADPDRPPEMSPRKKPRKQLLNDANDSMDMEFISEDRVKKTKLQGDGCDADENNKVFIKRPTNCTLLQTYKHSWKTRNNHFQRYSDVKAREERRPSVTELANQRHIIQRVKGWKIHHLSTQFENLSHMESCVLERLEATFKAMDTVSGKECEKDVSRVSELIQGTIQRSKVILEQINDAKSQMFKGIDHEGHVSEIISRCASKRNFKKRDKY